LWIYFWVLIIFYIVSVFYTLSLLCRGVLDIGLSMILTFSDIPLAFRTFSYGIYEIIMSLCIFGLMYVFSISSLLSPFYTKKLIGNSKLPIGRRKF
jgi:hypothetical protein